MTPVLLFLSYISDLNISLGNSGSSKCSNNSQITFSTFCLSDQSPSNVKLKHKISSLFDRKKNFNKWLDFDMEILQFIHCLKIHYLKHLFQKSVKFQVKSVWKLLTLGVIHKLRWQPRGEGGYQISTSLNKNHRFY